MQTLTEMMKRVYNIHDVVVDGEKVPVRLTDKLHAIHELVRQNLSMTSYQERRHIVDSFIKTMKG